jgi:hypothetical protein
MKHVRVQFSMTYSVADYRDTIASLDGGAVEPRSMISQPISLADQVIAPCGDDPGR